MYFQMIATCHSKCCCGELWSRSETEVKGESGSMHKISECIFVDMQLNEVTYLSSGTSVTIFLSLGESILQEEVLKYSV